MPDQCDDVTILLSQRSLTRSRTIARVSLSAHGSLLAQDQSMGCQPANMQVLHSFKGFGTARTSKIRGFPCMVRLPLRSLSTTGNEAF